MPNMSYCMFENTAADLRQILDRLGDFDSLSELLRTASSDDERRGIKQVHRLVGEILEVMNELKKYDDEVE